MKSNFEVNEDSELTTRGFITMHEAQLQQEGEEEIRTLFRKVSKIIHLDSLIPRDLQLGNLKTKRRPSRHLAAGDQL